MYPLLKMTFPKTAASYANAIYASNMLLTWGIFKLI